MLSGYDSAKLDSDLSKLSELLNFGDPKFSLDDFKQAEAILDGFLTEDITFTEKQRLVYAECAYLMCEACYARHDYDQALSYATVAIGLYSQSELNEEGIERIANIYCFLAAAYDFDNAYKELFHFAFDYLTGKNEATFDRFAKMEFIYCGQTDQGHLRHGVLLQVMQLMEKLCCSPALAISSCKIKLQNESMALFQRLISKHAREEARHIFTDRPETLADKQCDKMMSLDALPLPDAKDDGFDALIVCPSRLFAADAKAGEAVPVGSPDHKPFP